MGTLMDHDDEKALDIIVPKPSALVVLDKSDDELDARGRHGLRCSHMEFH